VTPNPTKPLDRTAVKAGVDWSHCLKNPGISYDDKLGMRFFFGYYN
jgi:hypothetical protein